MTSYDGGGEMRTIGVITFARSAYGACLPILRAIEASKELRLHLIVAGMHISPKFGNTIDDIQRDGFHINDRVEMCPNADSPTAIGEALGLGLQGFARSFAESKPDIVLIVGDRLELLAAASAALPFNIPVGHISGGDITEGALDNQVRHAVSKMSHIHFAAIPEHRNRLLQMGEEPWRIFVTGEPSLDLIKNMEFLSRFELEQQLKIELKRPVVVMTHHPTTLTPGAAITELQKILHALKRLDGSVIITYRSPLTLHEYE